MSKGVPVILVSALLFAIFGAFLGPWRILGTLWPLLLILLGLYLLGRNLLRSR